MLPTDMTQIEQLLQCISKESSLITNVLEEATKRSEKRDASVMQVRSPYFHSVHLFLNEKQTTFHLKLTPGVNQVALLKKQAMFEHRKFQEEWHGMGRLVSYNIKIIEHIQVPCQQLSFLVPNHVNALFLIMIQDVIG